MLTDEQFTLACETARKFGVDDGRDAAQLLVIPQDTTAVDLLNDLEDRVESVWEQLPRIPDLSGEFAGDMTPSDLIVAVIDDAEIDDSDEDSDDAYVWDDILMAYEDAASTAFIEECSSVLVQIIMSDDLPAH